MKIGTLTHMHGYNYGGVLQCASLLRVLSGMGHDVSVIDFPQSDRLRYLRRTLSVFGHPIGRVLVDSLRAHRYGKDITGKFEAFRRDALSLSSPCNSTRALARLARSYDALIVGSDQVWSRIMGLPEYFLSFAPDYAGYKVSYAACFGQYSSPAARWPRVGEWLAAFDAISVRNEMSRRLVRELCGRESEIVADPVMLSDFQDLAVRVELPFERYMLLYGLSAARMRSVSGVLAEIRRRLGVPIVGIRSSGLQPWLPECVDYVVHNPGVGEWLGLLGRAEYVATDSFHGTLLAIKGGKQFFSFIDREDERVSYVVGRYGVQAGMPADSVDALRTLLDYPKVAPLVREHVEQSMAFLSKSLGRGSGGGAGESNGGNGPCCNS